MNKIVREYYHYFNCKHNLCKIAIELYLPNMMSCPYISPEWLYEVFPKPHVCILMHPGISLDLAIKIMTETDGKIEQFMLSNLYTALGHDDFATAIEKTNRYVDLHDMYTVDKGLYKFCISKGIKVHDIARIKCEDTPPMDIDVNIFSYAPELLKIYGISYVYDNIDKFPLRIIGNLHWVFTNKQLEPLREKYLCVPRVIDDSNWEQLVANPNLPWSYSPNIKDSTWIKIRQSGCMTGIQNLFVPAHLRNEQINLNHSKEDIRKINETAILNDPSLAHELTRYVSYEFIANNADLNWDHSIAFDNAIEYIKIFGRAPYFVTHGMDYNTVPTEYIEIVCRGTNKPMPVDIENAIVAPVMELRKSQRVGKRIWSLMKYCDIVIIC